MWEARPHPAAWCRARHRLSLRTGPSRTSSHSSLTAAWIPLHAGPHHPKMAQTAGLQPPPVRRTSSSRARCCTASIRASTITQGLIAMLGVRREGVTEAAGEPEGGVVATAGPRRRLESPQVQERTRASAMRSCAGKRRGSSWVTPTKRAPYLVPSRRRGSRQAPTYVSNWLRRWRRMEGPARIAPILERIARPVAAGTSAAARVIAVCERVTRRHGEPRRAGEEVRSVYAVSSLGPGADGHYLLPGGSFCRK